ncbi:hypothetical protein F5878DRAFT_643601 [Lentinula raphanica]|uniref:Cupin type-2 domain-containing protein n=1 Tax=Lentinula raphanica TaxID=153919 RepID=A0AA38UBI5_9AGAR|nr:hypothetical protein F5878DRAFT_643601 [Lentinula raphanica]
MPEYSDSFEFLKGVTLVLEPQLRIVKTRGGADDDIFKVPLHWHEDHDEIITVLEGRLKVTLGKDTKVYTPESGEAFVPRGTRGAAQFYDSGNLGLKSHLTLELFSQLSSENGRYYTQKK